ncbi:MAG: type II secretion system F family protein [Hydrogenothermaceae bacterium]|nr:type II secretion system F family protein [Hydrogenothermaceae bacterium]
METFFVYAVDTEGKRVRRLISSKDEVSLLKDLRMYNLYPLTVIKVPAMLLYIFKYSPFSRKQVKLPELSELFDNLHVILKSGIPIISGINDIIETTENKRLKVVLQDINSILNTGGSISEAFSKYSDLFGPTVITLIKVGEETGTLDRICKDASTYYKKIYDIRSKTKQALIYPAFTLFGIMGAMLFWMIYVLPKIIEAFENFDIELPIITKFLIASSAFLKSNILFIIIFIFGLIILIRVLRAKNYRFKFITDIALLKLPVIGVILTYFYYAFISEYMRVMIKSGVSISRSLEILKQSVHNELFKTSLDKSLEMIINGTAIAEAFKKQQLYSPMIIRMISIGENTGSLEEQFEYISSYYYGKVDYITQNIAKMIEPIVMMFVGVFMLVIILGLMGPIYNLISSIAKTG